MHATNRQSSVGRGRFAWATARFALATALVVACSSPYEGGGRVPIPSSADDATADDSASPFASLSPVDAGAQDARESEDASNQEPPADGGFDVFSLFGDLE
jgi:hypothetical protein